VNDGSVQIAYLHGGKVAHSFHDSMMRMIAYDSATSQRITSTEGPFSILTGSVDVPDNRNFATKKFLDETPYEWLMFIDTDMGFLPDSVDRLIEAADPQERPIVGGLCFSARAVAYDGYGGARIGVRPTLFMPARNEEGVLGFKNWPRYEENSVMRVGATGAAFLLMHRSVLEKVRAEYGDEWWSMTRYDNGQLLSEDLSFCARAGALQVPVHVHTGVKTTHHKQIWVSEFEYQQPDAEDE
jgi:hypothetical protein